MNMVELFRYSVSDLKHRWMTAAMNIVAIGISVVYVLVLGFYALSTHRYQQRIVEEAGPGEKIVVASADVNDTDQWFDSARIDDIACQRNVRLAFPCVELNVDVSLDGQTYLWVPFESTAPGDPTTSPLRMSWGGGVSGLDGDEVILGEALFQKLGGALTADGPVPDRLFVRLQRTRRGVEEIHRKPLRIAGLLRHQPSQRIYLPAALAADWDRWASHRLRSLDLQSRSTVGFKYPFCYAYVPQREASRVADELGRLELVGERCGGIEVHAPNQPLQFTMYRLDGRPLAADDLFLLFEASCQLDVQVNRWCEDGQSDAFWWLGLVTAEPPLAPDGDNIDFSGLAWSCASDAAFTALTTRLLHQGLLVDTWDPAPAERLWCYRIRPVDPEARPIDDPLVGLLRLAQPTFASVRPYLAFSGRLPGDGQPVTFVASDPADPARHLADLWAGNWIEAGDEFQIGLPRRYQGAYRVGERWELVAERSDGDRDVQQATVPLRIVGIADDRDGVVPLPLAVQIIRWQQGELDWDAARLSFVPHIATGAASGHIRCTVIADSVPAVAELVSTFQRQGMRTVDQLDAYQGLVRLAGVLALLVALAVLGCVLNGAITVLVSTMMSIRSKTFEIGILRAHGFRNSEVLAIFLMQAFVLGGMALLLASAAVYLAEPPLRELICGAMGIRPGVFSAASLFTPATAWLFALAAGIALVFSVVGVAVPAGWACRLSPVEALRRRE